MESRVSELVRIAKTPVILIVVLVALFYVGSWAWKAATAPAIVRPADACVMTNVGAALTPDRVTVRTFNGGTTAGLAGRVASNLRASKFKVVKVANTDRRVTTTIIVGNAQGNPEVQLVMGFFKGATFEADNRPDHTVDVLVGNDFAGFADNPALSIPVSGAVCLPASATPSPSPKGSTTAA